MGETETIRVLCVEDDDNIRLNAVEALKDAGFSVLEARDSDQVMALIRDPDSVDVVFTDVAMPGNWDGVDLVDEIRRNHPFMPAIVTSGYASELAGRLKMLVPPTVFINKPYRLSQMVQTLGKLVADAVSMRAV